jgi:hypothetical protein
LSFSRRAKSAHLDAASSEWTGFCGTASAVFAPTKIP